MSWNKRIVTWMDRRFYPDFEPHWDNKLFRVELEKLIHPQSVVLDLGAGAGVLRYSNFRGRGALVCGVDPDPRVLHNAYLDEAHVGTAEAIPYPDNTFDIVFAFNVLEHLPNPVLAFREVFRVLKPSGIFAAKTPNKWHYMPIIARATPHWFHEFVIGRVFTRTAEDTFPTLYRVNTGAALRRCGAEAGFEIDSLRFVEGRPEYLRFSAATYGFGVLYERIVNRARALRRFRVVLISTMRKPAPAA